MENGLTYFQTRCMSCHRENDSSKAPSARRIRQMTPEQIYAVVSKPSRPEHDQGLTDPQKRRMSEFMGGYRQIGSVEAGNPKNFPNACPSNPPMSDPYAGAFWSGWGADIENTRYQRTEAAGITKADVPKLKLKWAFGFPLGISAYSPPADRLRTRIRRHGYRVGLFARRQDRMRLLGLRNRRNGSPGDQHRSGDRAGKYQIRGLLRRRQGQRLRARCAGRQAAVEAQGGRILSGAHHRGSEAL